VVLNIENATKLYGLQINCQTDPTILAWQNVEFGNFFTDSLTGANTVDAAAGTWVGAISQKNPAPALNGNGLFATLTFEAIAPGTSTVTCEPLAANRDGFEVAMGAGNTSVTVNEAPLFGLLNGSVLFQGRSDHSGITVDSAGTTQKTTVTDATGQFQLADLENGEYTVTVDANLYLPTCATASVTNGQVTTLEPTLLIGGDTNDDNEIRINDATLIGSNFGLTATSNPVMNSNADINADGQVNVQDLSILGGNFGKSGCQNWTPDTPLTETTAPATSS
jgi:hypothetical protein